MWDGVEKRLVAYFNAYEGMFRPIQGGLNDGYDLVLQIGNITILDIS